MGRLETTELAIPIPLPIDFSYAPAHENISEQWSEVETFVLIPVANERQCSLKAW